MLLQASFLFIKYQQYNSPPQELSHQTRLVSFAEYILFKI